MNEVLSQTFGRPGKPGSVEVTYMSGLRYGCSLLVRVGFPGKGGRGGPAVDQTDDVDADPPFVDRGGAGGGRENAPILEALIAYAESRKGTRDEPLCFLKPGDHQAECDPTILLRPRWFKLVLEVVVEAPPVTSCPVKMVRMDC